VLQLLQRVAGCCSVLNLQRVAACRSVLQRAAACCRIVLCIAECCNMSIVTRFRTHWPTQMQAQVPKCVFAFFWVLQRRSNHFLSLSLSLSLSLPHTHTHTHRYLGTHLQKFRGLRSMKQKIAVVYTAGPSRWLRSNSNFSKISNRVIVYSKFSGLTSLKFLKSQAWSHFIQ